MLDGPCRSGESKRLERQVQETSTLISDKVGAGIRGEKVGKTDSLGIGQDAGDV